MKMHPNRKGKVSFVYFPCVNVLFLGCRKKREKFLYSRGDNMTTFVPRHHNWLLIKLWRLNSILLARRFFLCHPSLPVFFNIKAVAYAKHPSISLKRPLFSFSVFSSPFGYYIPFHGSTFCSSRWYMDIIKFS